MLVGLIGPRAAGQDGDSALRLATGMQRVTGGEVFFIDTGRAALHYADAFRFRHVVFEAPFGPLDYLAAVEHCVAQGASVVVIDLMSHEHEGLAGCSRCTPPSRSVLAKREDDGDKVKMAAWQKPKAGGSSSIACCSSRELRLCFRAKEKLKIITGQPRAPWVAAGIAGDESVHDDGQRAAPAGRERAPTCSPARRPSARW